MRVLYLDLDTLRPDHLGCYGYHRNTSPNIDRIAAQGVRFEKYYCSDAPCLPSRAALMTGRFGIHTGVVGHGGTAADMRLEGAPREFRDRLTIGDPPQSLPMIFRRAGMRTASFSSFAERHAAWWYNAGFQEMFNSGLGGNDSAEGLTPKAVDWIERNGAEDDWFLHINYWDPHTPYRAPESFGNPFAQEPLPAWITEDVFETHKKMVGPHKPLEISMFDDHENPEFPRQPGRLDTMDDLRKMIDGYDCGIRHMDDHIGKVFDALAAQGVMDDVAVIISSDHGENQGELGIYGEHGTADEGTCRIPMIIRWPGGQQGQIDTGLHYNLDLPPTLADLFDTKKHELWDGKSTSPAILDGADCGRDQLVLSQCAHVCQRSVRFGPWLYMRSYHDGYHLFPKEMLFNLEDDPYEQHDLAEERPEVVREAVYRLTQWHDDMMGTMECDVDPLWTVIREGGPYHARGQLTKYCERLEETGRAWAIPELKKRHPGEFS
jgi:arylsulfatase A-like enzyme